MTDQLVLEERAAQAKELLNHPLIQECLDAMEWQAFEKAVNAPFAAAPGALLELRAIRGLRAQLQTIVSDADMARAATRRRRMSS